MTRMEALSLLEITDINATEDDIRKAYRKAVKLYHPDLHPDMPDAHFRMAKINEANDFLNNPANDKRMKVTHSGILNVVLV